MTVRETFEDVDARRPLQRFAVGTVLAVAMVKTLLVFPFLARYGWHRDELYYFAAGHHPALGYVDFPPVVPLLGAAARCLFGSSLVGLRSLSLVAGAGVIELTALTARELGGGGYAQVLAAVAIGFSPLLLATNMAFQTVSFDQLAWSALLFAFVRLLRTGGRRLWPIVGALAGVALMTKYTVALLLVALAIGLLAHGSGRRLLGGRGPRPGPSGPLSGIPGPSGPLRGIRGPLVAAGVCLVIVSANLSWQVDHGWVSAEFLWGQNAGGRQSSLFGGYLKDVALLAGPLGLVLAVAGLRRLARIPTWRPLAWAAALPLVGFALLGGKGYYGAPAFVILFAAGAVSAEHWTSGGRLRWARLVVPAVAMASLIPALPTIVPVLSRSSMVAGGTWESRKDYADEIGWPE
ncbi:MAG: glycosyltransferase family 39 protein, partial [Actinomycetota bacterium]|nr:glycosyltransferase family 39 protein [Actinomycetota bacterium]